MPTVAIAGGASPSLGRSIVTGIFNLAPHWKIRILSRPSSSIDAWLAPILESGRAEVRRVNYTDHSSLVSALQGTHTVICVFGFSTLDATSTQLALLKATIEAGAKRFSPAEYGIGVLATPKIDAFSDRVQIWEACEKAAAAGDLEWTRYQCGLLMNYLGFGVPSHVSGGDLREESLGGREADGEALYYTTECRAELPVKADGTFPRITFTAVEDIGKFVAKSLDLPAGSWETTSNLIGDTLRMDEVVQIVEKAMGKKWKVETVTSKELEGRIESENDPVGRLWPQLELCYTRDTEGESWLDGTLNRLFPDVTPLTVEAYMKKYYGPG